MVLPAGELREEENRGFKENRKIALLGPPWQRRPRQKSQRVRDTVSLLLKEAAGLTASMHGETEAAMVLSVRSAAPLYFRGRQSKGRKGTRTHPGLGL